MGSESTSGGWVVQVELYLFLAVVVKPCMPRAREGETERERESERGREREGERGGERGGEREATQRKLEPIVDDVASLLGR